MTDRARPLNGKVAIVTGAAGGQGLAEARLFAECGASVVMTDVQESITDQAATIGERARGVVHDVTSRDDWVRVAALATESFGGIDILVNNAGVYRTTPLLQGDEAFVRGVLDINLFGAWLGIQVMAPLIHQRGGGAIVNVSSLAGIKNVPEASAYVMSKFAVRGLTKAAAYELGPLGIRVNAILPGIIRTPMIAGGVLDHEADHAARLPVGRIGEPTDVAELALFLASDASGFITGADHVIDGGSTV